MQSSATCSEIAAPSQMRDDASMETSHLALLPALCALAFSLVACAGESSSLPRVEAAASAPKAEPAPRGDGVPLLRAIQSEIGTAVCDDDSQCRSAGVGMKPCGGPEAYLAWSSKVTDRTRLEALLAQHRDARRRENERSGVASDCRVTTDPGAVCRTRLPDGRRVCGLGQGGQSRLD